MAVELLRVPLGADVSDYVAGLLRDAARAAPAFSPAPVIYMAANERRARAISRAAGEQYPEGTPDRVARELLKLVAPQIRLRGEVERDFDFFGALAATLNELGDKRRPGRALVDELLVAWKRVAQTIRPDQRGGLHWLRDLGPRGELFSGVVRRYMERLKQAGRHDPEDALWLAAEYCDVRPRLVIADDLDRITPARETLLRALAEKAERTLIILRGRSEQLPFLTGAHEASQELMFLLNGRVLQEQDWAQRPLADACEAWLDGAPVKAEVTLLRPPTRAGEVRETARLIKRSHASGVTLGDICVAMPSTNAYRELIEETFTASGIPYDAPFELPLDETAPVAALLDLLRAARNGLERNELLDAVASPFLPFAWAGQVSPLRAALDEVTRDVYVVGGRDVVRDWIEKLDAAEHPKWAEIREPVQLILSLLKPFTQRHMRAVKFFDALEALLSQSGVAQVVAADRRAGLPGAGIRADALHAFTGLLREMREEFGSIGNPDLSLGELSRALTEQAGTRSVRPPESGAARVRVLGLRELRGMSIKRLIVLGLTDQDLPLTEEETLFLPASREDVLAGMLGVRAARELCAPIDVAAQGDYLFAHMLMASAGELTLMLPAGEGDTPFVPATPFARLLRAMNVDKLDALPATQSGEAPTSYGELAGRAAGMLTGMERSGAAPTAALPLSPALRTGLRGRCIELARTDMAAPPGEYEGVIAPAAHIGLAARFAADAPDPYLFSPSQLDNYAECPMRFWGRYILRAKAPEEPTLDTKPHAIGTLLHEVFERWVLLLRQEAGQSDVLADATTRQPLKLSEIGGREVGLRLMARAFKYACERNPGEGPFWDGVKKLVASGMPGYADEGLGDGLLVRFVDHELERNAQGWGIRFVEFDFGKDNEPVPDRPDTVPNAIELDTPGGGIRLMGSVDRVDESPEGLEIIDYKTGRTKSTADVRDGKAFQLPTYLAAVSQLAGTPPKGMKYFQVPAEGAIKAIDVTLSNGKQAYDVNELVFKKLPERLGRIVEALRHGVFVHTPFARLDDACKYCDYAASCAKRDDVIAERQARMAEGEPEVPHVYLPEGK